MIFLLYASDSSGPVDAAARMGLQQFKSMLQAAKVTSSSVPPEKVDEVYTMLQTSPGALSRSVQYSGHFGRDRAWQALPVVSSRQVGAANAGCSCYQSSRLPQTFALGTSSCLLLLSQHLVQHIGHDKWGYCLISAAGTPSNM